jgi:hypothetical protein
VTALEKLEQVAGRVKWRLSWVSTESLAFPGRVHVELDILKGRQLVNPTGPFFSIAADEEQGRNSIARAVLSALPRRGARPS